MNTEVDRKITVILVADVVGYSKHMERDENATLKAYAECEKILKACLKKYKGSIFNTAGDSALAEFPSAVNAVECGVAFQDDIKKRNESDKTKVKLAFRIGINMGDVVKKEGNLFGDGVNIAARLEALAQPNGISISKSVYDLVVPKTKMTFNDLGVQKVKQNEFHAFDILLDPSQKRKLKTKSKPLLPIIGAVAAVLVVMVGVFYFNTSEEVTTKKRVISSKPLVFVSSIDSSRLSDDDKKYVEGITGNVISSLSKSKSIRLVPTKTAQSFEKNEISSEELFETHGVKFLVSSSLQIVDSDARVNIEISDLEKKQIVISSIKDLKLKNIFEFQDQFGESILSEFLVNILNQKGLYESYFSWREMPISTQQLIQYVNFRSEMGKFTEQGFVNASSILSEMKKWPGPSTPEDWLVQDTWLNFYGMMKKKIPINQENLTKLKRELDKTIEIKPSPENYASRALLSFYMQIINCEEAFEDLNLAHKKAGNADSYGYASIVYGRCGNSKKAAENARNAFDLLPVDTNWHATARLAFRLYEDNQIEEMYSLLEGILDAIDIPVSIQALLAYDKLKNGDEQAAKYYFSKAKANRYSKNVLAQAIYSKEMREDAIATLNSFKY